MQVLCPRSRAQSTSQRTPVLTAQSRVG